MTALYKNFIIISTVVVVWIFHMHLKVIYN